MSIRIITMSVALVLCSMMTLYCYWRYKRGSQPHKFYYQGFFFLVLATLITLTRKIADPRHPIYIVGFGILLISVIAAMVSLYKGWKLNRQIGRRL